MIKTKPIERAGNLFTSLVGAFRYSMNASNNMVSIESSRFVSYMLLATDLVS